MSLGPSNPRDAIMAGILRVVRSPICCVTRDFYEARRAAEIGDITLVEFLDFVRRQALKNS